MTPYEHYRLAEQAVDIADEMKREADVTELLCFAQVHATLSLFVEREDEKWDAYQELARAAEKEEMGG